MLWCEFGITELDSRGFLGILLHSTMILSRSHSHVNPSSTPNHAQSNHHGLPSSPKLRLPPWLHWRQESTRPAKPLSAYPHSDTCGIPILSCALLYPFSCIRHFYLYPSQAERMIWCVFLLVITIDTIHTLRVSYCLVLVDSHP
jgi:hypothetical protein